MMLRFGGVILVGLCLAMASPYGPMAMALVLVSVLGGALVSPREEKQCDC